MNQQLTTLLTQYLTTAQAAITKYAPQAWAATLELIRLNAAFDLIGLAALTIGSIAAIIVWHRFLQGKIEKQGCYEDWHIGYVGMVVPGIALIVCLMGWTQSFSDWLGLFDPQLSVVYHVALKVGLFN